VKVASRSKTREVATVEMALDLFEAFLSHRSTLNLTELSTILKVDRETTASLVATLEARAYLRVEEARSYSLGVRLFELGSRFRNQLDIRRAALPELTSMVEETGQAGFLCVRDGDYGLCLERIEGRHFFHIFALRIGERQPLHCGGAPRALLSGMSDSEILAYATRTKLPRCTSQTITTLEALMEDVERTRRQGYVTSEQDVSLDIAAIGVPILSQSGKVVASISLSGIASTYTPHRIEELAETMKAAVRRISHNLNLEKSRNYVARSF
jgi:IclR family transcriptional regulator, KDG regulon repressor